MVPKRAQGSITKNPGLAVSDVELVESRCVLSKPESAEELYPSLTSSSVNGLPSAQFTFSASVDRLHVYPSYRTMTDLSTVR